MGVVCVSMVSIDNREARSGVLVQRVREYVPFGEERVVDVYEDRIVLGDDVVLFDDSEVASYRLDTVSLWPFNSDGVMLLGGVVLGLGVLKRSVGGVLCGLGVIGGGVSRRHGVQDIDIVRVRFVDGSDVDVFVREGDGKKVMNALDKVVQERLGSSWDDSWKGDDDGDACWER